MSRKGVQVLLAPRSGRFSVLNVGYYKRHPYYLAPDGALDLLSEVMDISYILRLYRG
jgi:hypothetical protein